MGIFDDMENFIIDHFSVTKRHNIQQTIEVTNSSGQQLSLQGQVGGSEQITRQGLASQRSQVVSLTQQGQVTSEQSSSTRTQHVVSASAEQVSGRLESSSRSDRGSTSDIQELKRSPPLERSAVPSSPFRERVSWGERAGTPVGMSEIHRSPQLEHVGVSSPFRNRQRASWIEQSISSGSTEQKRAFSFEHVSGSPGLRRSQRSSTSSEHQRTPQSEHGPINSPFRPDLPRTTSQPDSLPPNSPSRSERHRSSYSEQAGPGSAFRCDCRSPQADNVKNAAIIAEKQMQQGILQPAKTMSSPQFVRHNIDVSVTAFSKPKLVRLRSEPCTFSTASSDVAVRGLHQSDSNTRRRREELKRSQSFEASSPSRHEALWTGINIPNQLVITRPQLSRSRLNRKHLSLHLEGMSGDLKSHRPDSPLQFHDTHGDNIELQNNKTRARRYESFCKGICFSNRPIAVNEKVYVKFVETNTSWSGVLRFGFTSINPDSLRGCDLPRYACPDLTNKPGNWAKALGERYTTSNILLHFSVNRAGDVTYGVNGEEKGIFFSGVATSQPLWAMLDIYGNTVGVEFSHANAEIEPPANASQFDASPLPVESDFFNFTSLSLTNTPSSPSTSSVMPSVQWHVGITFSPLQFHRLMGRNVRLNSDRTVAVRQRDEYCNAFVFTPRPVHCGETIVIQVLSVDRSFIGGLSFGLTSCDPANVDPSSLPDDSDLLLDRREYWVVNKDLCRNPEIGDELSFHISEDGEVRYARNNQAPATLMHVDRTLPLWAFFDVYGNVQQIKLLGTTLTHVQGRLPRSQSLSSYSTTNNNNIPAGGSGAGGGVSGAGFVGAAYGTSVLTVALPSGGNGPPASLPAHVLRSNSVPVSCMTSNSPDCTEGPRNAHPTSLPATPLSPTMQGPLDEEATDCKVCWERVINCVLYTCGHMCLCFECAMTICSAKGLCPICRRSIKDVIRIYKS